MSAGWMVKCDPETMLSNGAEEYYLFIIVSGQIENFNFSLLATNEPKWWFGCLFCLLCLLHVIKFNDTVGSIYLEFA